VFTPIPNHVQQALARLIYEYQDSPLFQGLLTAMLGPIQDIENALTSMNTERYLPNAVGVQLDNIGEIIGLPRPAGASDAQYIQLIYAQIKENTSDGQAEQIIQVFLLLTGVMFVLYYQGSNAEFLVESVWVPANQSAVDSMIEMLENTAAGGVRCDGIVVNDPVIPFAYDGSIFGAGYDDGSQTVGGKYAELFLYVGGGFAYDGDDPTGLGYGSIADPLCGGTYLT
jgi:hypothetical protein